MSFQQTGEQGTARISVHLNPREGLAEAIQLHYRNWSFIQALDYEQLPFRCHICHMYGHMAKDFPLPMRKRPNKNKNKDFRSLAVEENQNKESKDMDSEGGSEEKAHEHSQKKAV